MFRDFYQRWLFHLLVNLHKLKLDVVDFVVNLCNLFQNVSLDILENHQFRCRANLNHFKQMFVLRTETGHLNEAHFFEEANCSQVSESRDSFV